MPRFLALVAYKIFPPEFGGQKGIAGFLAELGKQVPLICLCSSDNQPVQSYPFDLRPALPVAKSQWLNPLIWQKILKLIRQEQITHVILEHSYYGLLAKKLKRRNIRVILHAHNIEYIRFRESGRLLWPVMKWIERHAFRYADLILCKTVSDQQLAAKRFKLPRGKTALLPYGIVPIDRTDFAEKRTAIRSRHGISEQEPVFFFCGTLDYQPNASAMERLAYQLAPAIAARYEGPFSILVCGRTRYRSFHYLRAIQEPHFVYAGEVEDISAYFAAADLFVNPVASGAGIQTKNIDALAHGLFIVSSRFAAQGMPENAGDALIIVEDSDWPAYASALIANFKHAGIQPVELPPELQWEALIQRILPTLIGEGQFP